MVRNQEAKGLFAMAAHKYKLGQAVHFRPKKSRLALNAPVGPYQITKLFPKADGELKYAIRTASENSDRVARESELSRLEDRAPLKRRTLEI